MKREGADSKVVDDDEKSRACPEPDAVVKTEDMELCCKAELTVCRRRWALNAILLNSRQVCDT